MIEMTAVGYGYGAGRPAALREVTLDIPAGSFRFLVGPSGAGKTTLLRLLQMDLMPTHGVLKLFGEDVKKLDRDGRARLRRRLGLVFQDFRLLEHLSAVENVALPLFLQSNQPDALALRAVDDMLTWVGLSSKKHVPVSQLSGGEKQRVALARAVVTKPDLLIADEPTGNVDAAMARKIMHLLTELHKHGTTVMLATHDQTLLAQYDFDVIRLEDGRLA